MSNPIIDPTKPAKYPVILSDGLMGGTAKEIFTNIRYNHKPAELSESAQATARLRPSTAGSTSSYDVSFQDEAGKYAYAGTRTVNGNQYILYFDPSRKAFILDRVDSSFNMNLTRTPDNTNPESLAREFEQLDTAITVDTGPAAKSDKAKAKAKPSKAASKKEAPKRRPSAADKKKKDQKPMELPFPAASPLASAAAAPSRTKKKEKKQPDPDEDEDEDDDNGLLEVIGDNNATKASQFSPAIHHGGGLTTRRFSEFVQGLRAESENESAMEDDGDLEFKLPSPVGVAGRQDADEGDDELDDDADADGDPDGDVDFAQSKALDDLEQDLEAELNASAEEVEAEADFEADFAAELDKELGQENSTQNVESESEVSEED